MTHSEAETHPFTPGMASALAPELLIRNMARAAGRQVVLMEKFKVTNSVLFDAQMPEMASDPSP